MAKDTSLKNELKELQNSEIFSENFRKKRFTAYAVRTIIAILVYVFFWDYEWVRLTIWVYIPLNLLGLFMIFGMPHLMKKRMERIKTKIDEMER